MSFVLFSQERTQVSDVPISRHCLSCKARWGEDSILNTSARIAGKALALGGVKGIHRLDKPDRADGDHVVLCAVPGIVFFADMRDQAQVVGN